MEWQLLGPVSAARRRWCAGDRASGTSSLRYFDSKSKGNPVATARGGGRHPIARITLAIVVAILVVPLTVVIILLIDANVLRQPIADVVSRKLDRPFAINGDLDIGLLAHPHVETDIANRFDCAVVFRHAGYRNRGRRPGAVLVTHLDAGAARSMSWRLQSPATALYPNRARLRSESVHIPPVRRAA